MKQVGVEVELLKDLPSDVIAEELKAEQVTPEQVLKRSSRAIRVPDRYVPFLHYRLVTDEGERKPLNEALQLEDTTSGSKPWMMGCLGFRNALFFHLLRLSM